MNLGAEPKKVAILAVLVLVGSYAVYNAMSGDAGSSPAPAPRPVATNAAALPPVVRGGPRSKANQPDRRQISNRANATAWNLRLGSPDPADKPDPATIDPAIKLDLLAKVQAVELGAPGRNLFVFGSAPPPPMANLPKVGQIAINKVGPTPPPGPPPPPFNPPPPSAPPITLKYYGFKISRTDGNKAAFLLDGEDILIGGENDVLKKHYRIVRINAASIVIEDTDFKTNQTLQIQETPAA